MRRNAATVIALAAAATVTASSALGVVQVTEHFNDDPVARGWSGTLNTTAPQNYGFKATDTTGASVNPPTGAASGAGEIGGDIARVNGPASFYGVDLGGGIDIDTTDFYVEGVIRVHGNGGSGFFLGYSNGTASFGTGGDPANFIGFQMDDGRKPLPAAWTPDHGRTRIENLVAQADDTTVPFSMTYDHDGNGGNGSMAFVLGAESATLSGFNNAVFNPFTYFGVMPVSANGGTSQFWVDDLSFTAVNVITPPPGWNLNDSGDYNVASNWIGGVPNGNTATATFGSVITSDVLVYSNSAVTLKNLVFDNSHSYLLAGLGTLTMQADSGNATVSVMQGTHEINLPLTVASNTTLSVPSGTTLKISDPVTVNSGASLSQTGSGTVTYESTVTVLGGGSVAFGNSNHIAGLTVNSTGNASLTPGNNKTLRTDNLSISGRLDLRDNRLITPAAVGSLSGSTYTGVTGLIQSGRNGNAAPLWDGNGIVTSQSSATGGNLTSIGIATGSQVKGIAATATAVWNGQTVTGTDTLVMYTYGGDANLDGKINVDDYGRIDFNVPLGTSGWFNGDFNYDGKINVDDYGIIDFNIGIQGAPLGSTGGSSAALTAVPEPASLGLLALGAASMLLRRRRQPG